MRGYFKGELRPCECGSGDIECKAFGIVADTYVICNGCGRLLEIEVPWGEMNQTEHDSACFEALKPLWNTRPAFDKAWDINMQTLEMIESLLVYIDVDTPEYALHEQILEGIEKLGLTKAEALEIYHERQGE